MKKLTKIIASLLIIVSALILNPIGVSAEWRQCYGEWKYTEGNSYATGWRSIDGNWYYFDNYYSIMATGWIYDESYKKWYFLNKYTGIWDGTVSITQPEEITKAYNAIKSKIKYNIEYHNTIVKNGVSLCHFYNTDYIDSPPEYYYNESTGATYELSQHTIGSINIDDMYKMDCQSNI